MTSDTQVDESGRPVWLDPAGSARRQIGAPLRSQPVPSADGAGPTEQLARGLGWFSLGLGLVELVAPERLARAVGVLSHAPEPLLRAVGLREIVSGVGILRGGRPIGWYWARVGGDLMDLALIGLALRSRRNDRDRLLAAGASVLGVAALDWRTSRRFAADPSLRRAGGEDQEPEVRKAITVARPVEEVYAFWHDFGNLPRFMQNLEAVRRIGDGRWHWVAEAPLGRTVAWDAEVVADLPNRLIAWRSLPGSDIENRGAVRFKPAPGERGTEVHVDIQYALPGGKTAATLAKLFPENPDREVYDDLRAFKQVLETGEVVKSAAVLGGGRLQQRPAQPPSP